MRTHKQNTTKSKNVLSDHKMRLEKHRHNMNKPRHNLKKHRQHEQKQTQLEQKQTQLEKTQKKLKKQNKNYTTKTFQSHSRLRDTSKRRFKGGEITMLTYHRFVSYMSALYTLNFLEQQLLYTTGEYIWLSCNLKTMGSLW